MIEKKRRRIPTTQNLKVASARNFKGGLNTHDTPLNLNSRYLTKLNNLYPDSNGRLQIRFGTSLLTRTELEAGNIIAAEYYNSRIVLVTDKGRILTVRSDGIAMQHHTTWSPCTTANFTPFDGKLVICNGVDKPVIMDEAYVVAYLGDPGNAFSNVNVPRAMFCATFNQFLVLATGAHGGSTTPSTLFIASKGTAAVMLGDPGSDNNAVNYNISRDVTLGDPSITGLVSFRGRLLVATSECIIPMVLGEFDEAGNHAPRADDVIQSFGAVSQQVMLALGDDVLLLDTGGVSSVQRALITGALSPVRESTLIQRDLQAALKKFTPANLARGAFAIHDRIQQQVLFFISKDPAVAVQSDNNVFVYCFEKSERFRAWTHYDGLPFRCGCRTAENRVFLCRGNEVYFYHNQYEPYYNDLGSQPEPFSDGTRFTDGTLWFNNTLNLPILFNMRTTWSEFQSPGQAKFSRYFQLEAEGDGTVDVSMYVDRLGEPITTQLTVRSNPEKHVEAGDVRPATQPMLYALPMKFTRARFEVSGQASAYVSIVAIHVHYSVGTIGR